MPNGPIAFDTPGGPTKLVPEKFHAANQIVNPVGPRVQGGQAAFGDLAPVRFGQPLALGGIAPIEGGIVQAPD